MKLEPVAWQISRSDAPLPFIVLTESERDYWTKKRGNKSLSLYAIPSGYVVVPVEPTPKMMAAGFLVSEAPHDPAGVYRAMITAAQGEQ